MNTIPKLNVLAESVYKLDELLSFGPPQAEYGNDKYTSFKDRFYSIFIRTCSQRCNISLADLNLHIFGDLDSDSICTNSLDYPVDTA